ncbi:MAG: hypothetical protein GY851_21740 [bacterium]|nr:hypothetical protein [bacterium]
MSARDDDYYLMNCLSRRGIDADAEQARVLRRAERTLHGWAEQECGNGNDWASWAIERDEDTGKPYRCIYPHDGPTRRELIADREAGAIARVRAVCADLGVHWYQQTDPRGCALYVSSEPIDGCTYTNGVACSVR